MHSLVDDVLGHNAGDKVPMEKVVMLVWAFRDDPSVIKFMAQFVSKVSPPTVILHVTADRDSIIRDERKQISHH